VLEIFRVVGVHSDGGRSQERVDDDNQFSDKLQGHYSHGQTLWKAVELHEQHYNKIQRGSAD
jgi:hypothetical protein